MGQKSYNPTMVPGRAGMLADDGERDVVSLINDNPRAAQVTDVVVDTAANSTKYSFTIDGVEISYTSDGSATKTEIANGLADAVNAEPLVNGLVSAESDGTDTVTITARIAGVGYEYSESDANLSSTATTANAEADPVWFGAPVVRDTDDARYGRALKSTAITQRSIVTTFGGTAENDKLLHITLRVGEHVYNTSYDTGGAATLANIAQGVRDAINALSAGVTASSSSGALTVVNGSSGLDVGLEIVGIGLTTLTITKTSDNGDVADDLAKAFEGIALHEYDHEVGTLNGEPAYEPGEVMSVCRRGRVIVPTSAEITSGRDVYYVLATATFADAAASGRVLLPHCRWRKPLSSSLAVVQVR